MSEVSVKWSQSEHVGELIDAFAKAQADFGNVVKDSSNPFYNSKYADLANVVAAVRPSLNKQGIALIQIPESDVDTQRARVVTILRKGEQWLSGIAETPAVGKAKDGSLKFDVQTLGAAWTYLRRYILQAMCGLASEDDDGQSLSMDSNAASRPVQNQTTPKPKAQLPEADIARLSGMLEATDSMDLLKTVYREAVQTATKAGDQQALVGFTAIKEQQKKKIEAVGAHS
jgi:hypothetical protein